MPSEPPQFVDHFWGDRHLGFDVLQHTFKHANRATSELLDLLRESCSLQETNYRALAKFARQMGSYTASGTFTPCWTIVKILLESQSALHLALHQYWTALMKDVQKYGEELSRKFKELKDLEAPTQEVVYSFQTATQQLQKSRETYHARYMEWKKLRACETGVATRDLEKVQTRLQKSQNEYKYMVERYNNLRNSFIERMRISCSQHQALENAHLQQMRQFLSRYVHALTGYLESGSKPLQEFQQRLTRDFTIPWLLQRFATDKGTGRKIPAAASFEEGELFCPEKKDRSNSSGSIGKTRPPSIETTPQSESGWKGSISDLLSSGISLNGKSLQIMDTTELPSPNDSPAATAPATNSGTKSRGLMAIVRVMKPSNLSNSGRASDPIPPLSIIPSAVGVSWRSETPMERPVDEHGFSLPPADIWKRPDEQPGGSSSESSDEDIMEKKVVPKVIIKPLNAVPATIQEGGSISVSTEEVTLRNDKCGTLTRISQVLIQPPAPSGGGRASKGRSNILSKSPFAFSTENEFSFAEFGSDVLRQQRCKSVADMLCETDEMDGNDILHNQNSTSNQKDFHLLSSGGLSTSSRSARFNRRQGSVDASSSRYHSSRQDHGKVSDPKRRISVDSVSPSRVEANNQNNVTSKMKVTDPWSSEEPEISFDDHSLARRPSKQTPFLETVPEQEPLIFTFESSMSEQSDPKDNSIIIPNTDISTVFSSPPLPPPRLPSKENIETLKTPENDKRPSPDENPIAMAVSTTEIHHVKFNGEQLLEHNVDGELRFAFPSQVQQRFMSFSSPLPSLSFKLQHVNNVRLDDKFFVTGECVDENDKSDIYHLHVDNVKKYVMNQLSTSQHRSHVTVDLLRYRVPTSSTDPSFSPLTLHCAWSKVSDTVLHLTVNYRMNHSFLVPLELVIYCDLPLTDSQTARKRPPFLAFESQPGGMMRWQEGRVEWPVLLSEFATLKKSSHQAENFVRCPVEAKFTLISGENMQQMSLVPQPVHAKFTFDDPHDKEGRFTLLSSGYRLSFHKRRVVSGEYLSSSD